MTTKVVDEESIDALAKKIWEYHLLHQPLKRADCILVLGSHDIWIADYGAELYHRGLAGRVIFSGGVERWGKPEADAFAEVAIRRGVPAEHILIERRSTNTGENLQFTEALLIKQGLNFGSFIIVQKPYMERRTWATAMKLWPTKAIIVTSPEIKYEDYVDKIVPKKQVINTMVGDLQRIRLYGETGFQIPQVIPDDVWDAYTQLVSAGYSERLLKS